MIGLRIFFSLLFPAFFTSVQGQLENRYTYFLDKNILNAKDPKDKVEWLCIASRYYMEPDEKKSAALIDEAKLAAKADTRLTLMVLLLNAERLLMLGDYKYYINKSIEESKNVLAVAGSNRMKDMQVGAYLYLAEAYNSSGELLKADSLIKIGLSIVSNKNEANSFIYDSLAVECLVTQSRIQQAQRKLSESLISASDAYKRAKDMHNDYLQYLTEKRMGLVYSAYGRQTNPADHRKAREYFRKSTILTKPRLHEYQLIDGYVHVAESYENENNAAFLDSALENYRTALWLAEKTDKNVKLPYIQLRVIECLMDGRKGDSAEFYLEKYLPGIQPYFEKVQLKERLFYRLANIYKKLGLYYFDIKKDRRIAKDYFDSSYKYFYNAHGYYKEKATETARTFFYIDYGVTSLYLSLIYKILNREAKTEFTGYANSGNEATKRYDDSTFQTWGIKLIKDLALPAAWASGNRTAISNAAYWLEGIYKNESVAIAYNYRKIYDSINVLLRNDATEEAKAITSYEQTEADKERNEKERKRRDNYQYLFITISVVFVFILLTLMGFIRVPAIVIRLLGFFSFILLFEFIILIADSFIHNITHGEPWKVLAFKIVIAAILVPLHHYLEKKVISYLMKRQLLRSGSVVSGKK